MADGTGDKRPLGKIMLKQRLVTAEQLDGLLAYQRAHPGERLATAAVASGHVDERALLEALSEQHGLPAMDLRRVALPLTNLDLIPEDIAERHLILPVLLRGDRLFLAMADPTDARVIEEIEFVTGRRIHPYVALHGTLREVIAEAYRRHRQGEPHYVGPDAPPDTVARMERGAFETPPGHLQPRGPETEGEDGVEGGSASPALGPDPVLDAHGGAHAAAEDDRPTRPLTASDGPPRVLVVDDEEDIRKLLGRVLTQKGYEVLEASQGLEALQAVRDHVPDVLLLDANLPEVHGFDICRRIRGSKRYGHIPIIMVSAVYRGWRFAEDLKRAFGVSAYLEKPFKIADVLSAVERALDGRAASLPPEDAPSEEAAAALEAGMEAYRRGDLDEAIAKLADGVHADPLSFQLHYHLGLLYGRRDALFDGIHALEAAVDLQPRSFQALKNLAVLYQRVGFKHKAIEVWERALAVAPDEATRRGIKDHLVGLL